jgi:hypothetical protein
MQKYAVISSLIYPGCKGQRALLKLNNEFIITVFLIRGNTTIFFSENPDEAILHRKNFFRINITTTAFNKSIPAIKIFAVNKIMASDWVAFFVWLLIRTVA